MVRLSGNVVIIGRFVANDGDSYIDVIKSYKDGDTWKKHVVKVPIAHVHEKARTPEKVVMEYVCAVAVDDTGNVGLGIMFSNDIHFSTDEKKPAEAGKGKGGWK